MSSAARPPTEPYNVETASCFFRGPLPGTSATQMQEAADHSVLGQIYWSLHSMYSYIPALQRGDLTLEHKLKSLWPDIWKWSKFILSECVDKNACGSAHRLNGFMSVARGIRAMLCTDDTAIVVTQTPGVIGVFTKQWLGIERLRPDDPALADFKSRTMTEIEDQVFFMVYLDVLTKCQHNGNFRISDVLDAAGGRPEISSRSSVRYLRKRVNRTTPDPLAIGVQLNTMQFLSWHSDNMPLRVSSLMEGSLEQAIKAIMVLSRRTFSRDVQDAMLLAWHCIINSLLTPNGETWAARMLGSGVIATVSASSTFSKRISPDEAGLLSLLYTKYLPPMLMFRSVVRSAAKAFEDTAAIALNNATDEPLAGPWRFFARHAMQRIDSLEVFENNVQTQQLRCSNVECADREVTDSRHLKKCTGCMGMFYCSKACQTAHWSQHKTVCRNIQNRIREGRSAELGLRDQRFMYFIAGAEIKVRIDEVLAQIRAHPPSVPRNSLVLSLNYTSVPMVIQVKDKAKSDGIELLAHGAIETAVLENSTDDGRAQTSFVSEVVIGVPEHMRRVVTALNIPEAEGLW